MSPATSSSPFGGVATCPGDVSASRRYADGDGRFPPGVNSLAKWDLPAPCHCEELSRRRVVHRRSGMYAVPVLALSKQRLQIVSRAGASRSGDF